jgi:hypothetical protein
MKRHKRQKNLSTRAKATRTLRKKLSQAKVAYDVTTASAETIGHRAILIGGAMTNPAGLSNPEFATMGHEKVLVGGQAAMVMMRRMGGAHRIWTDFWFQQMQRTWTVLPQLAGSRTPERLIQVATDSAGTVMSDCMAFWMKATNFSEAIADAGAKPIHRAVVSNAKRLARAA